MRSARVLNKEMRLPQGSYARRDLNHSCSSKALGFKNVFVVWSLPWIVENPQMHSGGRSSTQEFEPGSTLPLACARYVKFATLSELKVEPAEQGFNLFNGWGSDCLAGWLSVYPHPAPSI